MTSSQARNCVSCGRAISWEANVCPYCGHDYRYVMAGQIPQNKETAMPIIGGILVLIAGLIEIGVGIFMAVAGGTLVPLEDFGGAISACGVIFAVVGIIAVIGGVFAVQRRNFAFALVGAILSLGGYFVLGLIGLILIVIARDEFEV